MKKIALLHFLTVILLSAEAQTAQLKYMIYDFDGLDLGQADLPDGDYKNFDLDYEAAANPSMSGGVLGDRVLKLDLNWSGGTGEFGKGVTKYIELNPSSDRINFYFLNPASNYDAAIIDVVIKEDDNLSNVYESSSDDRWMKTVNIPRSGSWQLISIPLNSFTDANAGGNSVFDAGYSGNGGKLLVLSFVFHQAMAGSGAETYFMDMICFSEGALPVGSGILDLPSHAVTDKCSLGSYAYRSPADSVPPEVEAMFPAGNKLEYVNIFMPLAYTGTSPSVLPGSSIQRLMDNGYRPVITWEMMYTAYSPFDPVQPSLNDIISGSLDSHIDAFANQVKTYSDTLIIRLFHEFDGNWYPWCIELNGQNPASFIAAYRHIVNRFNVLGVSNVLWMWSPNSSAVPSASYNWFVDAYPGDAYVDVVGTSVYNHPLSGIPSWRSFRAQFAEVYYYFRKYFPAKPVHIAESGCRERYGGEVGTSQSKAGWICQMGDELKSYFNDTRALVFLHIVKGHDWRMNSSFAAKEAIKNCLWTDPYFGETLTNVSEKLSKERLSVEPNPFTTEFRISLDGTPVDENTRVIVYDLHGRKMSEWKGYSIRQGKEYLPGMYILELQLNHTKERIRIIKQ